MAYIKSGFGFHVGNDFAGAPHDIPMQIRIVQNGSAYGTIARQDNAPFAFLQYADRIDVRVSLNGVGHD
jgi:hypothetical protein